MAIPSRERHRGVGVGPPLDRVELLDADRHATERQRHVGDAAAAACSASRSVEAEGVEVARVDRGEHGLELLDRRALTAAERVDESRTRRPAMRRRLLDGGGDCTERRLTIVVAMDTRTFLGLEPTHNPFRWKLPVTAGICARRATSCSAAPGSVRRSRHSRARRVGSACGPPRSTCRTPKPGEVVDIDVTIAVEGHQITQARAVCHVADREILTVNAALGERDSMASGQFETMPRRAAAARSARTRHVSETSRHDQRPARAADGQGPAVEDLDGTPGDGQTMLWARIPDVIDGVDATDARRARRLRADGRRSGARRSRAAATASTTRCASCRLVPTEWVLLDIRVHAVERGFGHGLVHMFAEDGTLLATASQSCIVRFWKRHLTSA